MSTTRIYYWIDPTGKRHNRTTKRRFYSHAVVAQRPDQSWQMMNCASSFELANKALGMNQRYWTQHGYLLKVVPLNLETRTPKKPRGPLADRTRRIRNLKRSITRVSRYLANNTGQNLAVVAHNSRLLREYEAELKQLEAQP